MNLDLPPYMEQAQFQFPQHIITRFCIAGINYHKADTTVRGQFAVTPEKYAAVLNNGQRQNIKSLFVLSTCNRTEIYAFTTDADVLADLVCENSGGNKDLFLKSGYIKKGTEAVHHLFMVASGLDSQITGDNEIVGQLKLAVAFSRERGMIGPVMDRMVNYALQASKKIRTVTKISNGTVSVSYATIEWLRGINAIQDKQISIIGLGKFGRNVCKNMQHYFTAKRISVCNRTDETALKFAQQTGLTFSPYALLTELVDQSDIIIVCSHSGKPVITADMITPGKKRVFIDLSIPSNIEISVGQINGQQLVNVDDISIKLNKTIEKRKAEIPVALQIIGEYSAEYYDWLKSYQHHDQIKEMKQKLYQLSSVRQLHNGERSTHVQKTVNRLAVNLRTKKEKGCQFIQAYNQFLNIPEID